MELIALSPHLDDAAFSLGATIAKVVAEGGRARVIGFFSDAPPLAQVPERLRVFADYATRRAEDAAALDVLGARPTWLGMVERAFRTPHLERLSQVFRTPADPSGFPNLARMRATVTQLLRDHPAARVCAPLGVGNHFDHVEVFVAAAGAMVEADAWDRVRFYEDAYAVGTGMRRAHFVTRTRRWPILGSAPDTSRLRLFGLLSSMALARRGPPVERLLPEAVANASWTALPEPITAAHEQRKLDALARYPSQLDALGGLEGWREALRRYHRRWGDAEPLWSATPGGVTR